MIYFKDEEIKIRDVSSDDINYLFMWNIDKELNKYDPKPIPKSTQELLKECKAFCKKFETEIINQDLKKRKYKYFIITNQSNYPIGFVNLFSIDKVKRQGEMGVIIGDKRYFKKGIAYKSIKNVIEYIFNNTDIMKVYIETSEFNIPALKLFEKLDFKRVDEYLEDDNFKFIVMEKLKI
ncbi:MAG: GNAT family N-acetyltransferase [Firmicutes bacterium]|nr:GNAT family N-acetyltransferase [Bacillota bacterium]